MRKSREEAAETRRRIVAVAAAELRAHGVVATGLNELMAAAGLTRGGFYKHFASKDQLVAEAVDEAMRSVLAGPIGAAAATGRTAAAYLSPEHRDRPAAGCPIAAIGAELSRGDDATRAVATAGVRQLVDLMATQGDAPANSASRRRALAAVSTLVGALTLSRIVDDPKLSQEILREAAKSLASSNPPV